MGLHEPRPVKVATTIINSVQSVLAIYPYHPNLLYRHSLTLSPSGRIKGTLSDVAKAPHISQYDQEGNAFILHCFFFFPIPDPLAYLVDTLLSIPIIRHHRTKTHST